MNYLRPELIDRLAAEYVVGTLGGGARRRFERLMMEHRIVRRHVSLWQDRLNTIDATLEPVAVPGRLWRRITRQLDLTPAKAGWWSNISLWRGFGLTSFAATLGLSLLLAYQQLEQPSREPAIVAVLNGASGDALLVSQPDLVRANLQLTAVGSLATPSGRDLELWTLPDGAAPVSLGVIHLRRSVRLTLNPRQLAALTRSKGMAVSVEPLGGSPTGAPTGAILLTGKLSLPLQG